VDRWEEIKEEFNNFESEVDRAHLETDLVFAAAFGLDDELRQGVYVAINKLYEGQINVRMISGDNIYTATKCAQKAGIIRVGEESDPMVCMLGADFRQKVGGVRLVQD
jgi:P-type E1-E2 ATPase